MSVPQLVLEPSVRVLATTAIVDEDFTQEILDDEYPSYTQNAEDGYHSDGEYLIEFAGRNCYQSFHNPASRSTDEYIKNIVNQRHFSVLEHTSVTFFIEGISRSCTHDFVRHRHLSYSQLSQRYVDPTNAPLVVPPLYRRDEQLLHEFKKAVEDSTADYARLLWWTDNKNMDAGRKIIREAARSILPNAQETKLVVTGNLRAWRDFLEKRWTSHADAEIAEVAGLIASNLKHLYPSVFADINYDNT